MNQLEPLVEALRYMSPLAFDTLTYVILTRLNMDREKVSELDTNLSFSMLNVHFGQSSFKDLRITGKILSIEFFGVGNASDHFFFWFCSAEQASGYVVTILFAIPLPAGQE